RRQHAHVLNDTLGVDIQLEDNGPLDTSVEGLLRILRLSLLLQDRGSCLVGARGARRNGRGKQEREAGVERTPSAAESRVWIHVPSGSRVTAIDLVADYAGSGGPRASGRVRRGAETI